MTEGTETAGATSAAQQPLLGDLAQASTPLLLRESRVLLGWLDSKQAGLMLQGRRADLPLTEDQQRLIAESQAAVRSRPAGAGQDGLIQPLPDEAAQYVDELRTHHAAQPFFTEGWEVALADLPRVCAFQPQVFIDHAAERVAGVDISDTVAVAGVTLPTVAPTPLQPQYDTQRQAFVLSSANPNLRVGGYFAGPVGPAAPELMALGFQVGILSSFVQVAEMQGRFYLRDGYHRALGLLQAGVTFAPVFVRRGLTLAELIPAGLGGMLSYESFAGERPPTLRDYWEETVSCDAQLPAAQKIIMIQAIETMISG